MKDAVLVFGGGSDHQTIHTLYTYGTKTGKKSTSKIGKQHHLLNFILNWTPVLQKFEEKSCSENCPPLIFNYPQGDKASQGRCGILKCLSTTSRLRLSTSILPILPPVEQYVLINRFLYQIQPLITRKLFIFWIRSCNAPLLWGLAISLVCWGTTTGTCPETRWKTLGGRSQLGSWGEVGGRTPVSTPVSDTATFRYRTLPSNTQT